MLATMVNYVFNLPVFKMAPSWLASESSYIIIVGDMSYQFCINTCIYSYTPKYGYSASDGSYPCITLVQISL